MFCNQDTAGLKNALNQFSAIGAKLLKNSDPRFRDQIKAELAKISQNELAQAVQVYQALVAKYGK